MKTVLWKYLDTFTAQDIASLFRAWREQQPGAGILALVSEQEPDAVALLQQVAADSGMTLLGAVVPGLIVDARFQRKGILLFAFDAALPKKILPLPHEANRTSDTALNGLVDFVESHAGEDGTDTLLLLVDAMTPDMASLLDRLYLEIGDMVNYAGTSVGSETFKPVPCVFDNETFIQDAVLAMILPRHPGVVLAHHYCGNTSLHVATATAGNRIRTIDGRPAFEIYQEMMQSTYGIALTRDNFYQHSGHYPFAINLAEGEPLVRIPVAFDDDGSVFCVGEVPENAVLSVVEALPAGNMSAALEVASGVRNMAPDAALVFYCAGRLMHLGEAAAVEELAALSHGVAHMPLFGALSLGEIGSGQLLGYPQFHNATIVALPWA